MNLNKSWKYEDLPKSENASVNPPVFPSSLVSKPKIVLPSGNVSLTDTAKQLFPLLKETHRIFRRGDKFFIIFSNGEKLRPLTPDAARSEFDKVAFLIVWRGGGEGELKQVLTNKCPRETAVGLLETQEAKTIIPEVLGVVNFPIITEKDGKIHVSGKGYDAETKMFVFKSEKPLQVLFSDAKAALFDLVSDFDFVTPSDKTRAIASILTPALKLGGFINGSVPCDVAEANESQSGKTFRHKIIAAIYNENLSIITNRKGGVGSVDESFNQSLVNGSPFLQLENFRGKVDSQHIEAFMTAEGRFDARIPHVGNVEIDPSKYFLFLTSNGVESTRDFANRSSICRIKKQPSDYKFKEYPEGDLLTHIKKNQPFYLGCVFAVIQEWHAKGKIKKQPPQHDFRDWASTLRAVTEDILGLAPLMDGHLLAQVRVSNPSLNFVRNLCLAMEQTGEWGHGLNASKLAEFAFDHEIEIPGGRPEDVGDVSKANKIIGIKMATLFKEGTRCEVESFFVTRTEQNTYRGEKGYILEKLYSFGKDSPQPHNPHNPV